MKKTTVCEQVLRYIRDMGPVYPREIRQFVYDITGRSLRGDGEVPRSWWNSQLYGTWRQHGLLRRFCTRLPDGRYILSEDIRGPFLRGPRTRSQDQHIRSQRARLALREKEAGDCPNCHTTMLHKELTPDKLAHRNSWGRGYMNDCMGRVWSALTVSDKITAMGMSGFLLTDMTIEQLRRLEDYLRSYMYGHSYEAESRALELAVAARRV